MTDLQRVILYSNEYRLHIHLYVLTNNQIDGIHAERW